LLADRMITLAIVDDHEALRDGLAALLRAAGLDVVGMAGTVESGRDLVDHAPVFSTPS